MNHVTKAERSTITVAGKEIEVFMLPDGSFRYSLSTLAAAIEKQASDAFNFLSKNQVKSNNGKASTLSTSVLIPVGKTRIRAVTDTEAALYWQWKADNGNVKARALLSALAAEALHRRSCFVFGIVVTEAEQEARTKSNYDRFLETYERWTKLPKELYTSVWGSTELMSQVEVALLTLSPAERASIEFTDYVPIFTPDGSEVFMWQHVNHQERYDRSKTASE